MTAKIIPFPRRALIGVDAGAHIEPSNVSSVTPAQQAAVKSLRRTAMLMRDGDDRAGSFLKILMAAVGVPIFADAAGRLLTEISARASVKPEPAP